MSTEPTKPDESNTPLTDAIRSGRRAFMHAMGFSLAINLLGLMIPIYSMQVFDRVLTSQSYDTLIGLTLIMFACLAFYGAFNAIRGSIITHVVEWMDRALAPKLLHMSIRQSAVTGAAPASQYQRELLNVKNFISSNLVTMMDIPWSLIFLLVIYMINPLLGFIALLGIVILVGAGILNEYATKRLYNRAAEQTIKSMEAADSASRNAEAIEAMGMISRITLGWMQRNDEQANYTRLANQRSTVIQAATRSLRMILQIAITAAGAVLVLENALTMGGMIAASLLVYRAMAPFEGAIIVWKNFVAARDSFRRLNKALAAHANLRGETALPVPKGELTVENLYYQPPKANPILKGINFKLTPGESLGVIGPSAAGKSTLAKCLMGIYPPTFGTARLDGADVFTWDREDFGQYVGFLPQDVELFPGTIKQNIARMQPLPDDVAVIEAATLAGVHDMILRLPKGYDTEIKNGHGGLSPGQRQRVGLARAVYGSPKLVVLDEPNSNLDGEGEVALMGTIQQLKQLGITCVIIAHRPSVLQVVDKILTLNAGVVEAMGPRDEMLARFSSDARRRLQGQGTQKENPQIKQGPAARRAPQRPKPDGESGSNA